MIASWLSTIYLFSAAALSVYGFLGLVTLGAYWKHRHRRFTCTQPPLHQLPAVTVQLPLYNERYVVRDLIEAAVRLDYPHDRLQIQVIDDSSDDTTQIAAALVTRYRRQGIDICLLHRENRHGFKAGALHAGLATTTGEYLAIFDADFRPNRDFLQRTVPHFLEDPRLGMVQTRWGHLNASASALTAAQAIALDKHFAMEQTVRHRADWFPKFNGTAGIWRRDCLEDAGGWQDDTVCEDLCLSTRAVLKGWRFRFLNDVVAPAELPTTISAYKNQQARWAKGSSQCLLKYGPGILVSRQHSWAARLYAVVAMSAYTTHLLLLILLLLLVPLIYLNYRFSAHWLILGVAGIGQPLLFILGQQVLYPDWRRRLRHLPAMLLIAIGLAPSNARAIIQAVISRRHGFVRTPKGISATRPFPATGNYRLPFDRIIFVEAALALYAAVGMGLALWRANFGSLFLLGACMVGFTYVAVLGWREQTSPNSS
jgi:cellulose synthase/poly-beta-1,6-N-acetylglucosamine synthase-like glycosyltransferase